MSKGLRYSGARVLPDGLRPQVTALSVTCTVEGVCKNHTSGLGRMILAPLFGNIRHKIKEDMGRFGILKEGGKVV